MLTVRGSTIERLASATGGAATYDLGSLTLLAGFVDAHIGWRFDADGKYATGQESAAHAALHGAERQP